ncbi:MAG: 30S ribosomal protein S1 [Rickettsiaceae bacterium]|nr:30S ribosomal protein S1 [Rickettsiaceae bacterium]
MQPSFQKLKTKQKYIPEMPDVTFLENFEELVTSTTLSKVKEGTVVRGIVVGIDGDTVIVDVGLKNEGRIPINEFKLVVDQDPPMVGEGVDVYVERLEGSNGRTVLSREKAIREESWEILEKAHENEQLVDGVIFSRVKGGFTVDLSGVVAFLPGSQVDVRPIKDLEPLMDIVQPFKILKMDKKLGNIVVSRRAILEDSRSGAREEMLSKIKEGMILEGFVKNITDYGAFIDLGTVDGLLHVTDISWTRINHPSEVLSMGQKVKVMVIKFNEETKRISLGMRQLDQNPWNGIKEEFPVGKKISGKVTNLTEYGAFVEIKDGIEGLVHSSEISWLKSNQNPKKLLTIGQDVDFVVLEVDEQKHRISLSIKQCKENPWEKFFENNKVGDIIKGVVRNVADFGLFVAIGDEIDGMVHESDISSEHASEKLKEFKRGDEIECKILAIDTEKERVSLGIKQISETDVKLSSASSAKEQGVVMPKIEKGTVVTAVIKSIQGDSVVVETLDGLHEGIIKKADLASDKSDQKTDRFHEGDKIDAKLVNVSKDGILNLSIKAFELDERKRAIKEYGSVDSGASLGDILGAALNQGNKDRS